MSKDVRASLKGPVWDNLSIKKNDGCNQWKHIEYTKPSEFTVKLKRARPLSPNKNKTNTWVAFEVPGHLKVTNVT